MRGEEIARLKAKVAENLVIIDEIKEKHVYIEREVAELKRMMKQ